MLWSLLAVCTIAITCRNAPEKPDGKVFENNILQNGNLSKEYAHRELILSAINEVNCVAPYLTKKKLALAESFYSADTTQILVIPFSPNGKVFTSTAYSDIHASYILINPSAIKEFAIKNTLNDTTAFKPLIELMLLHEVGHFILGQTGYFDSLQTETNPKLGQQISSSQPEYITTAKKLEMSADSLAIAMAKSSNKPGIKCFDIAFNIELLVPGMQFQLSGLRMINNFGSLNVGFLHDPSTTHPNMELRITFMNYFLFRSDSLKQMIDDYIYNRTVKPVHDQLTDPIIYQGTEKKLHANKN